MKNIIKIKNYKLETIFYCFIIFWIVSVLITNCSNETQIESNSQPSVQSEVVAPIEPKEILYNKSLTESDYNLNIKEHKNSLSALESIPIDVNDYLVQEVFVKEEYVQSSTIEMDLLSMADLSEMPLMKILMELVINQRSMNGYNDIETNVNSTYLDTIKKFLLLVSKDPYVSKEESFVVENVIVTVSYNAPGHLKIKHTLK